jgi:hypothetical protein
VIFNNSQENTETKQKKPEEFKKKEYTAANPKKFEDPADSARNAFGLLKRKRISNLVHA